MGRPGGLGGKALRPLLPMRILLLAALIAAAASLGAAAPALAPHQAWAQEHDETRHGRLAVEESVYALERHAPVTVRITGQIFSESDERRQVDVVVTLPDSSRSEQAALATRGGHFAVPYHLDRPFPAGADSRPGRYAVSASHMGMSLGTVYFEVVRPPQVPAAVPGGGEAEDRGPAEEAAAAVSGLSASVSRPIYSPDSAVTVHGTAEGAGAGVRLRIDVAGPSAGVVYSGALTTSSAGTYSATIMAPDGRWGGDGEYTAVVTGGGQLARAPFWIESGDGGGGSAMQEQRGREPEEPTGPADPRQSDASPGTAPAVTIHPAPGGGMADPDAAPRTPEVGRGAAPADAAQGRPQMPQEGAGEQAASNGGPDAAVVLGAATVAVAAAAAVAVAVAVRKATGSRGRPAGGKRPAAKRPDGPGPGAPPRAAHPDAAGPPIGASARRAPAAPAAAPTRRARGGMRIVLDTSVVLNHKRRSEGELENLGFFGPQLEYVDSRAEDLLLPDRDTVWQDTREYASASLRPFESVSGYELHERALENLRKQLVDDPLSGESVRWIARKFRWADPEGAGDAEGARIGAILDRTGMPRREGSGGIGVGREAREAVARYGKEGGEEDLRYLLRHLDSEASLDLQILAIAMKESEVRPSILLANDYDFFAFPIWRGPIDASGCGPVTMVLGPADVRWIVSMRDGSARVFDRKAAVRELYSDEDYMEVLRALQYSKAKG